jgi:ATPase subunit of ABC transporter with duplicated ATPase domains
MLRPSGKHLLEVEGLNKTYTQPDGKTEHVIKNFSAAVMRGDKVVLIGRNGQGKTTMLKALLANAGLDESEASAIDSGTVKWGHEAQIGYFAQDHKGSIQLGMTAADWLHQFDPQATKEDIRGILGQMLFRGEEGMKKTDALSGGEAARLLFCKLMLQKPNVLVLDEPTNHLDLESINALNQAIQKYEGTVFLVTHDQDLIEEAGTRIWNFEGGPEDFHITDHKGPYEEYQQQLALTAK